MRIRPETAGSRGIGSYSSNYRSKILCLRSGQNSGPRLLAKSKAIGRERCCTSRRPVRIPLVLKEGGAVCTTRTPSRHCLPAAVGACQYGAAKHMARSAPGPGAARSIRPRVLVQRRIETESKNAMDRRGADRGSETLPVGTGSLSPPKSGDSTVWAMATTGTAHRRTTVGVVIGSAW